MGYFTMWGSWHGLRWWLFVELQCYFTLKCLALTVHSPILQLTHSVLKPHMPRVCDLRELSVTLGHILPNLCKDSPQELAHPRVKEGDVYHGG